MRSLTRTINEDGAIVGTATASGTTPTISMGGETYTNTDLVPTPAAGSHGTLLLPLQLKLLDGSKPDFDGTIPTNIISAPENPQHDSDVAFQTAPGGTSITSLGALAMGQGRNDFPGAAYTCSTIAAAQAPANLSGIQYQWQRWKVRRSWYIRMITDHSSLYYGQWYVTQRSKAGVPTPVTDVEPGNLNLDRDQTPNSTNHEFFYYDSSALTYGAKANDKASGYMNVGDFIHEEKVFSYQVQTSFDGANWTYGVVMPVTQSTTVKYQATGGTAATDWLGQGNVYTLGDSTPTITVAKVRAIVGGTAAINIDSAANN